MEKGAVKVGLVGLGTIGSGVTRLFRENGDLISKRLGRELTLARVADRDASLLKKITLADDCKTRDAEDLIRDPEIDIFIELIGGLEPARSLIKKALNMGKHVVTANKDLIATHGAELMALAAEKQRGLFYEASVGGGIPLIGPLQRHFMADRITRITGILNGTTNFILTRMGQDGLDFDEALAEAQRLGFAEADSSNDIQGRDAAYKLAIMASLAFGGPVSTADVYIMGIEGITAADIMYTREQGFIIKLLAIGDCTTDRAVLRVHPTLVPTGHLLAAVNNEFNAVFLRGEALGEVMLYGRGAGAMPTATAVLADVCEAVSLVDAASPGGVDANEAHPIAYLTMDDLENRFYLRFSVEGEPGILCEIARIFAEEKVGLELIRERHSDGNHKEIVVFTHTVQECVIHRAMTEIDNIKGLKEKPTMIRFQG